jgi:phospholipid-binding lipoprotein MlaA
MPTSWCSAAISLTVAVTCLAGAAAEPATPEGQPPAAAAEPDPLFDDAAEGFEAAEPARDPLEPANRAFFGFNQQLDRFFWSPITRAYRFVAPEPAREAIRRALRNLNTPIFFVNNVLQLRFRDAGETLGAFALNSTLGIVGLLEPGKEAGWEAHPADFGQTVGLVGVASGPYVVVPLLGPTTVRDGIGSAVDRFFQPLNYIIGIPTLMLWGGGAGLSLRDEAADKLEALEESSVDFYSVMRSAYLQNRENEISDARSRRDAQLARMVPESWHCDHTEPSTRD